MRALHALALLVAVLLVQHGELAHAESAASFVVVVHPDNPISSVDRRFVSDAFLKKITSWQGGERIRPVDQSSNAEVREHFTLSVLKRSVAAVRAYWQQQVFAGRELPPPEVASDDAVVRYVLGHKGAIGYVSGSTPLDRAKVLRVE